MFFLLFVRMFLKILDGNATWTVLLVSCDDAVETAYVRILTNSLQQLFFGGLVPLYLIYVWNWLVKVYLDAVAF